VFIDGKKALTLRGPNITAEFKTIVEDYIEKRFGAGRVSLREGASAE
jgi:(E)-4-hydroxy-3-methylbut-2-enyl-diphosphate synthase